MTVISQLFKSGHAASSQSRHRFSNLGESIGVALGALILSGCASVSPAGAGPAAQAAPAPNAEALPEVGLSDGLLFQLLLSEIAAQRGSPAAAFVSYMQLARETRDPRTAKRAAEFALAARRPDGALDAAQLWVSLAPGNREAIQLTWALMAGQGKLDVLEPLLSAEVRNNPNKLEAIADTQRAIARITDRPAAYALAQRVYEPVSRQLEAQIALAQTAFAAQQADAALEHAKRAYAIAPESERAALINSQLLATKDLPAAIAVLEGYLKRNPVVRDTRAQLGRLYANNKAPEKARDQFEQLAKPQASLGGSVQRDPDALYALGVLAMQNKDWNAANENFKTYLKEIDDNPERDPSGALMSLAGIAEEQRQYADAAGWYDQVESPDQQFTAQLRAALALSKGAQRDAAQKRLAGMKPKGDEEKTRIVLAQAQLARDASDHNKAYEILGSALKAAPDNTDLIYDRAMAAEKLGKFDEVETLFRRIIELKPDSAQAYNALGYTLADRNVRLDEAQKLVEKAVNLAPDDAFIMDSLGWVQYRQGKFDEALKTLRAAYDMKQDPEIAAHLGEVLWITGRRDEAEKLWRAAHKTEPANETLKSTMTRYKVSMP